MNTGRSWSYAFIWSYKYREIMVLGVYMELRIFGNFKRKYMVTAKALIMLFAGFYRKNTKYPHHFVLNGGVIDDPPPR